MNSTTRDKLEQIGLEINGDMIIQDEFNLIQYLFFRPPVYTQMLKDKYDTQIYIVSCLSIISLS